MQIFWLNVNCHQWDESTRIVLDKKDFGLHEPGGSGRLPEEVYLIASSQYPSSINQLTMWVCNAKYKKSWRRKIQPERL